MELPADAYNLGTAKHQFALREKREYDGKYTPAQTFVNQYRVKALDFDKAIYQYDVSSLSKSEVILLQILTF